MIWRDLDHEKWELDSIQILKIWKWLLDGTQFIETPTWTDKPSNNPSKTLLFSQILLQKIEGKVATTVISPR